VKVAEREERPSNVVSLMDALKQSLKSGKGGAARHSAAAPRLAGPRAALARSASTQGGSTASVMRERHPALFARQAGRFVLPA
jgi:hypothetical protein